MAKKKKQMRLLLIALGVVVLTLVGMVIWNQYTTKREAAEKAADTIHVTTVDNPTQITFYNGKKKLSFTKKDNAWTSDKDPDFPLDSTYLEKIVTTLDDLTADRKIDILDKLSAYGLKDPGHWVTVTNAKGKSATLYLGNATGEDYFAMLKGGKNVYTLSGELLTAISYDLYDMAELSKFPELSSSNTKMVTVSGKMTNTLTVEKADSDTSSSASSSGDSSAEGTDSQDDYNWYLSGDVDITKDDFLTALRTEIDSIAFSKLAVYQPKNLESYGLKDPSATLKVQYLDSDNKSQTVTLLLGSAYTGSDGEKYRYAMLKGETEKVYLVQADSVKNILSTAQKGYAQASDSYVETDTTTTTETQ